MVGFFKMCTVGDIFCPAAALFGDGAWQSSLHLLSFEQQRGRFVIFVFGLARAAWMVTQCRDGSNVKLVLFFF